MVETQLIASLRRNTKKGEHMVIKRANTNIERANTNIERANTNIERANTNIERANTRFAPTIRKLNVCIGCRRSGFVRSTKM